MPPPALPESLASCPGSIDPPPPAFRQPKHLLVWAMMERARGDLCAGKHARVVELYQSVRKDL